MTNSSQKKMLIEKLNKRIDYYSGLSKILENNDEVMSFYYKGMSDALKTTLFELNGPRGVLSSVRQTSYSLGFTDGKNFFMEDLVESAAYLQEHIDYKYKQFRKIPLYHLKDLK